MRRTDQKHKKTGWAPGLEFFDPSMPLITSIRAISETLFSALVATILLTSVTAARAQEGRIYTIPDPAATGAISGRVASELTHAIAVERDRVRVFLAALADGGKTFRFDHLPVGKYNLLFVSKSGIVFEALALGGDGSQLTATQRANLAKRIELADTFFKEHTVHRLGVTGMDGNGDAVILALVERFRANDVLKQSGERLNEMVHRLEVIELHQASDDWQFIGTRHLYREAEPIPVKPHFFKHKTVPALGNIRVIDSTKDLGTIALENLTADEPR